MAIYEVSARTSTTAAPEHVWAVLDDFAGWPNWMPGLENVGVELLSAGAPRVGYRFRLRGTITLVHTDLEVVCYTPRERYTTFQVSFPPLRGDNRCLMTPLDDTRWQIERIDHLHLPRQFVWFLDKTQRARFERLSREFVIALKRTAEQRAANAPIQRVG
jgi:hypothetical protein